MLANLVDYARQRGIDAEAGFTRKDVRWLIQLNQDGRFLGIVDQSDPTVKRSRGRTIQKAPHLKFSGDTPMRQFLVDSAKFALLFGEDHPDEKLLSKHGFFLNLLREAATCDPAFAMIADAIAEDATRIRICESLADPEHKAKPTDNVTFAIIEGDSVRILVDESCWRDWWRGYFPTLLAAKATDPMRCLITGTLTEPARTHPKVKGLGGVGGKVETTLVSFNERAFCSYGLEQSRNAAISKKAAEQYVASLNDRIEHGVTMAGTKVLYWYVGEGVDESCEDVVAELFGGIDYGDAEVAEPADDAATASPRTVAQKQSLARKLLDAIRSGDKPHLVNARFNALTLSGNSARVVIRDWMEGQFEELAENIDAWFEHTAIIRRDGNGVVASHKFAALIAATVRDLKDVAPPLVASLWHAAIGGKRETISHQAMVQTLARVKIDIIQDEPARHARLGLLKAYCIRKGINVTAELNDHLKAPAYLCGRIMAILASIQHAALGDVGAGVVQRYYAAASATPGVVLGRLIRQAQVGHLPKIDGGLRHWFDKQLAEVWQLLECSPPKVLSPEGQTLFAMGYYQQKAKRYATSTESLTPADTNDSEHL